MDKKKVILLVGALIVAIGTAFLARSMFAGASAPQAEAAAEVEPTGPKVLVAKQKPGTHSKHLFTGPLVHVSALVPQGGPLEGGTRVVARRKRREVST